MDKCDSHDECFKRLYHKVEGMDDKLDRLFGELHTRLHDGDVRFVQLEMRLAQCEKVLTSSMSGCADVRQKLVGGGIDLLKLAVIATVSAACWALANGYLK